MVGIKEKIKSYCHDTEVPTQFSVERDAQVEQKNTTVRFLTACLCCQHMCSDEVRCGCLPIRPSWPSPLLHLPEVHIEGHTRVGS